MIKIVTGDNRPIFQQIVDEFRTQIALGTLKEGTKIPSVRGLAMQLTINTNTVAKAYDKLTQLGLIESRKGLGLFVAARRRPLTEKERQQQLLAAINTFVTSIIDLDFTSDDVLSQLEKKLKKLKVSAQEQSKHD